MTFDQKIKVILIASTVLVIGAVIHGIRENYLDSTQPLGVGAFVRVKHGFYEDCKGTVLREVYSRQVVDRQGVMHPSLFAGYDVDLTCNNEHTGDRFFSPDFLRVEHV
jgi:hypothetical protein